jgi:hypothetical protein
MTRLHGWIERCHARHPNTCLVAWSAGSFQVIEFLLRIISGSLGVPWHPLIGL